MARNHKGDKGEVGEDECAIVFCKGKEGVLVRFIHTEMDGINLVPDHIQFGSAVFGWLHESGSVEEVEAWWQHQLRSPPPSEVN